MNVEAVRDDGAMLITEGKAAAIVLDGKHWITDRDSALSRNGWQPSSGTVPPALAAQLAPELAEFVDAHADLDDDATLGDREHELLTALAESPAKLPPTPTTRNSPLPYWLVSPTGRHQLRNVPDWLDENTGHAGHTFEDGICTTCSDGEPDGPMDEATQALLVAISELVDGEGRGWNPEAHKRIPKGQPGAGRFRSMVDRIKDAIVAHRESGSDGHPFDGFDREQLRRVAKARGIELTRGESRNSIAQKLLGHLDVKPTKKAVPAKAKPTEPPGARLEIVTRRELDKIDAQRELDSLTAHLKVAKDPGEIAWAEKKIAGLKLRIAQQDDGWHNWDSPSWEEQAAVRVVGTPSAEQIREHVDKAMPEGGMSAALHSELAGELERQGAIVPRSLLDLHKVKGLEDFDHADGQVMAYYRPSFREITFNPGWDSNRHDADQAAKHAQVTGWWVHSDATAAAATMAHEFGHHVSQRLFDHVDVRQRTKLAKAVDAGLGANGWITRHVRQEGSIEAAIDAWLAAGGRSSAKRTISEYGAKNSHELFAEVWHEYTTSNTQRPHIKAMGDVIRSLAEELDVVRL